VGASVNGIWNDSAMVLNKKAGIDEVRMVGCVGQIEKIVFLGI